MQYHGKPTGNNEYPAAFEQASITQEHTEILIQFSQIRKIPFNQHENLMFFSFEDLEGKNNIFVHTWKTENN